MNTSLRLAFAGALGACALAASAYDTRSGSYGGYGGYHDSRGCASGSSSDWQRSETLQVVGLTADNRLICFNERNPGDARDIGYVSGLMGDTRLVGIDFRVQDGQLYGVGNAGGIYRLDTSNGTATKVSQLTVALAGTSFGVDFNPPADRLRVTSDTGQNLRHNINPGGTTIVDDPLDYPPATPVNAVGPTAQGINGSAYTNNDLDAATATTLYALDSNLDQIAIQSPPNDGTLAATGKLGVDAGLQNGFDIYSTLRNGVTVDVQAFASLSKSDGSSAFYKVSLPTGKANSRGEFNSRNQVIGIAIPLNQL